MSIYLKRRASQRNGAKSHGPVTPEGKHKSSANSARYNLVSKTVVLVNERLEVFAELFASFMHEFNPQTEAQRALVESMTVARWRQMRMWALERATLHSAMLAAQAAQPENARPGTQAALAFQSLADESRTLDLLARYETRFERQFARSLHLFMELVDPECPLTKSAKRT
jgi:hypothetical protein